MCSNIWLLKTKIHFRSLTDNVFLRNIYTGRNRFTEQKPKTQTGLFSKLKNIFVPSENEFSKVKLSNQKRFTVRKYRTWAVNVKQKKNDFAMCNNWEFAHRPYTPIILRKDITANMTARPPIPIIREQTVPQRGYKKEEKKKDKKEKKSTAMHVQNNMAESHSQKSTRSKRIFRRKWGVRVAENIIHPNQSSELVKKNVPHSQRKHTEQTSTWKTPHEENLLEPASIESPNASKLRMSLLGNRSNDDSYVKRPERTNEVFKITDDVTQYSSDPEGSTVFDDEYYVPLEMTDEEIMDAWQEIVRKSRMPVDHVNPQLPAELQEIDSMFIRPEPPKPKLDIQTVRPISNPKSSTRYFSTCNCAMYSDPSNHTYPDSSSTNDLTHLNVIENNENSDSLYDCPLKLPIRPLTPIKYTYDYLQEDEDFMNSLSTVPHMILDFPIDEKLTENNPDEEKDNTVISFSKSPEGNVVTTAKESTNTAALDSTNIIPEKSLNIKPDGKDQSEAKFTVDGDFVRVDGDPYPYSREHFEKWRMPQKGFQIQLPNQEKTEN